MWRLCWLRRLAKPTVAWLSRRSFRRPTNLATHLKRRSLAAPVMSLNSGTSATHRGRKHHPSGRLHPNQSSCIQPARRAAAAPLSAATLPRSRSLIKASSISSSTSSSCNGDDQHYQLGVVNSHNIRIINNHIINHNNNNSSKQPNNEQRSKPPSQHNTMHKSVTIVATKQRSNSLEYLNFEEKRQLIASSLSISELLHCGPAAVKEAAANGEWTASVLGGLGRGTFWN